MSEQSNTSSDISVEAGQDEPQTGQAHPPGRVVVRYGRMMHMGVFSHDLETPPAPGTKLVVCTERGTELGTVVINVDADSPWSLESESLEQYLAASGSPYPFSRTGSVLRPANAQDINDQHHLDKSAETEGDFCREQIKQLAPEMRLVAVEHMLGGERIVFFFAAEHRVDFRELVRRLAGQYHTRIEMRQIGARDEARLLADYERCGRQCCCRAFLKLLKPISMRMAKTQKATLDPAKISGRCGRLMCCLRYEDKTYEELRHKLPKRNTWVRTVDGVVGKVVETQILTQLVRLSLSDRKQTVVPNEEIVERGLAAPSDSTKAAEPEKPPRPKAPLAEEVESSAQAGEYEPPGDGAPPDKAPAGKVSSRPLPERRRSIRANPAVGAGKRTSIRAHSAPPRRSHHNPQNHPPKTLRLGGQPTSRTGEKDADGENRRRAFGIRRLTRNAAEAIVTGSIRPEEGTDNEDIVHDSCLSGLVAGDDPPAFQ